MKRKGTSIIFFAFMAAFVVAGALVSNLFFNQYVSTLEKQSVDSSQSQFESFGIREEVMNAECITKQRGVYYKSRIMDNSDALTCIAPADEPIIASFYWINKDDSATDSLTRESYSYKITPNDPGEPSEVSQEWLDRSLDDVLDAFDSMQSFPIVVYDDDTNEYHQGVLMFSR